MEEGVDESLPELAGLQPGLPPSGCCDESFNSTTLGLKLACTFFWCWQGMAGVLSLQGENKSNHLQYCAESQGLRAFYTQSHGSRVFNSKGCKS